MRNVVVLGNGFLGKAFGRAGFTVYGRDKFNYTSGGSYFLDFDLTGVDVIINCIGQSNTRWCELKENFCAASEVNSSLVKVLVDLCEQHDIKLVHVSTGCLYDTVSPPQKESSFTVAHCNYTITKWMGEMVIDERKHLILRPRLYFGDNTDKNNLLGKLTGFDKLSSTLDSLASVDVIVEATEALLENNQVGIFNVSCEGFISMWDIGFLLGLDKERITPEDIRIEQGLYLVNCCMNIDKLKQFYQPPNIKDEIIRCWNKLNERN